MKHVTHAQGARPAPPLVLTTEGLAWLGVSLVLGGLGWWKSINLILLIAYLMLALLVLNGVLARGHARRIRAEEEAGTPVYAGEDATVRVTATNHGTLRATVTVEHRSTGEPVAWLVSRLAPGESVTCEGRWRSITRGRHRSEIRVSSAFPLGLLQCDHRAQSATEMVVLPAPGLADPDGLRRWVARHAGGDGRARKVLRRVTTDQADVRGVRPYRPGDPIRSIHWRSSARRNELMVREYDSAPTPDLVLIVEPWLPVDPTAADRGAFEGVLSLAVTIARTWVRVYGTRIVFAVAGEPDSLRATTSSDEGVREVLSPLAAVTGSAAFDPIEARAFDRSLARAARIVVSSRRDSPYADAMSAATNRRFVSLSPADNIPWYQPPGARSSGRETVRRRD